MLCSFSYVLLFALRVENILIQTPEGFFNTAERKGQVHADMTGPMEAAAILPEDTHLVAHKKKFIQLS